MKILPHANTKSAPKTAKIAAGKPKAQYTAAGLIKASNKLAHPVRAVPIAIEDRIGK
jgi:hypothetical protein